MKKSSEQSEHMSTRKSDHIELAFRSRVESGQLDSRFYYEPMLSGHPDDEDLSISFLGKRLNYPLWVSSMTGGTERARKINENLARLCGQYGLGMGLGSCRPLLESDDRLIDFQMRKFIGPDYPLYANLGIAQVEQLIFRNEIDRIEELVIRLEADGMIIHINPLQEWAQPEGDRIKRSPLETVQVLLSETDIPIIVKEVGQGMGPKSIQALLGLPLAAIEFGAAGGTNFTQLELHRSPSDVNFKQSFSVIGHTAVEMVGFVNQAMSELEHSGSREIIISGGVRDYLDGYYLMSKSSSKSIYGQASAFLKHAIVSYDELERFFLSQMEGLAMAKKYLHVKEQQ